MIALNYMVTYLGKFDNYQVSVLSKQFNSVKIYSFPLYTDILRNRKVVFFVKKWNTVSLQGRISKKYHLHTKKTTGLMVETQYRKKYITFTRVCFQRCMFSLVGFIKFPFLLYE